MEAIGNALRSWMGAQDAVKEADQEVKEAHDRLNARTHEVLQAAEAVKTAVAKQTALEPCGPDGLQRFALEHGDREILVEVAGGKVRIAKAHKV